MESVDVTTTTPTSTTATIHSDIIQTHILPKLDGPTLASTTCASSHLHTLCSNEKLWKHICDSTWPSTTDPLIQAIISTFPSGHRSFFADSFPTIDDNKRPNKSKNTKRVKTEFLSAVDVHLGDELLYSKVLVEKNMPGWNSNSALRIDLLEGYDSKFTKPLVKESGDECIEFLEENLRLSWIMIDPVKKRAVNLSSISPVDVRRHWMRNDYIEVHYTTVIASPDGIARFVVTVVLREKNGGNELEMIQISMQVEDLGGQMMSGKDSLVILHEAMDRGRVKREIDEERKRTENFIEMRRIYKQNKKDRKESISEMVWIATGVTLLMAFSTLIIYSCAFVRIASRVRRLHFKRTRQS